MGCSAGGHLAALLGTTGDVAEFEGEGGWPDHSSRVQAVCDWFGPADLPALAHQPSPKWDWSDDVNPAALLLGGAIADRPEAARRASPTTWATPDDPPFLIMHGTADALVSYKQSVLMAAALERVRVPVELVLIEDGEHGPWTEAFAAERRRRQVAEFFDTHLK